MTVSHSTPRLLTLFVLLSGSSFGLAQTTTGWKDDYRLWYSYDNSNQAGPANWGDVPSTIGWGEWEVVRLASAQEPTNSDGLPLIEWDDNQCGKEERPSPIELIPSADCTDTVELTVRKFNDALDCRHPVELNRRQADEATDEWEITPFSLRYYYPRTEGSCRRPTVRLDGIDHISRKNTEEHFVLLWLELHARSEHVIAGKRYDAELQMVHMATSRPNELVIISVLIEADNTEDHMDFQRFLLDGWQRKATEETETCSKRRELQRQRPHLRGENRNNPGYSAVLQDYSQLLLNSTLYQDLQENPPLPRNLQGNKCTPDKYGNGCQSAGLGPRKRLFPYNLWPSVWYFSYEGSIAAPPCQGNVHWRIIDQPL
jgi:carbonic anhydrase